MRKFLSVLTAIAFISAIPVSAQARSMPNHGHHGGRPQQQVVVNNYSYHNQGYRTTNNHRGHQNVYYVTKKKDKSAEIAAISLGVIGVFAIASSFAR